MWRGSNPKPEREQCSKWHLPDYCRKRSFPRQRPLRVESRQRCGRPRSVIHSSRRMILITDGDAVRVAVEFGDDQASD